MLKSGAKWPAITLHTPPMLQSTLAFEGSDACRDLQKHLLEAADLYLPGVVQEEPADFEDTTPEDSGVDQHDGEKPSCAAEAAHAEVERCSGVLFVWFIPWYLCHTVS